MTTSKAYITPSVLKWAREDRMGLTVEALAGQIGQKPQKVQAWEDDTDRPTIRQAQKLAKALRIPLGYLYLSNPPDDPVPIADFRRLPGAAATMSVDVREVIQDIRLKQERYKELVEGYGQPAVGLVGSQTIRDDPVIVAERLRATLGISELQRITGNYERFTRALFGRSERVGILVMRNGCVGNNTRRPLRLSEFRGLALSDPVAPVVFVNSRDSLAAQIFTFVHEVAHIVVGSTGLSDHHAGNLNISDGVERFCDNVAAESLIPSREFGVHWSDKESIEQNLLVLGKRFKTSTLVVLRRAYDLGKIDQTTFQKRHDHAAEAFREADRKRYEQPDDNGPGFNSILVPMRNSRTVTNVLVGAALEGRLLYREAASLLNIRPHYCPADKRWAACNWL